MDWPNFWTQLAGGLIGALIGGSAVAYFNGYYSKKGERTLLREELPHILEEERGKAYQQEKGKRLATHDDIENVLNEIRLVTKETETIKAQIGSDLWTQQMVWQEKRDIYRLLSKRSDTLKNSIINFTGQLTLLQLLETGGKLKTVADSQDLLSRRKDLTESLQRFLDAFNEANLFLSGKACAVLNDFVQRYGPLIKNQEDVQEWHMALLVLGKSTTELTKAAKEDLGVFHTE